MTYLLGSKDPRYVAAKARFRKKRSNEIRQLLQAAKDAPCKDCGNKYPYYVMDLDHRDPSTKCATPSDLLATAWTLDRVSAEIAKCDAVCANCHRERTQKQQLWKKVI